MPDLNNKTVVLLGASLGIGEALSEKLYTSGANLVMVARNEERLLQTAKQVQGDDGDEQRLMVVSADVCDSQAIKQLYEEVVTRFGGIDILINNAGFNHRGPFMERDAAQLGQIIDTNLKAPVVNACMALPLLSKTKGQIINVGSLAGRTPVPDNATYAASKAGLRSLTYALRDEFAGTGVSISTVSPGPVLTPFILEDLDHVPDIVFSQPLSTAEQVADQIMQVIETREVEIVSGTLPGIMTTLSYLFPGLRKLLGPALERKGRRVKAGLRREREKG